MIRLLQSFLIVVALSAFTVACTDSSDGKKSEQAGGTSGPGGGSGGTSDDSSDELVTKPDGEGSVNAGGMPLTKNKWCIKARFDNANYEYRLHFQDTFQLVYSYFYLKADFSRGDLAQEGYGFWNLVGDTLMTNIADEEKKEKMRLEPMSSLGHPQLHLSPGTPSEMTFNPCN